MSPVRPYTYICIVINAANVRFSRPRGSTTRSATVILVIATGRSVFFSFVDASTRIPPSFSAEKFVHSCSVRNASRPASINRLEGGGWGGGRTRSGLNSIRAERRKPCPPPPPPLALLVTPRVERPSETDKGEALGATPSRYTGRRVRDISYRIVATCKKYLNVGRGDGEKPLARSCFYQSDMSSA